MARNTSDDGAVKAVSALIVGVIVVISLVPKQVWIALGVMVATGLLVWLTAWVVGECRTGLAESRARAEAQRQAEAEAEKRERAANEVKAKQDRVDALGTRNAARVEDALAAVAQVASSEAARTGWLGDVDFSADIAQIIEDFRKARALRNVAGQLSTLTKPGPDDRRIFGEATETADALERAAIERVGLIAECSAEARRIDRTLQQTRDDERTAERRAELHGRLGALLYGAEASPTAAPTNSTADAVLARVRAYREIECRIRRARDR